MTVPFPDAVGVEVGVGELDEGVGVGEAVELGDGVAVAGGAVSSLWTISE
jgi:hypothetical protein